MFISISHHSTLSNIFFVILSIAKQKRRGGEPRRFVYHYQSINYP